MVGGKSRKDFLVKDKARIFSDTSFVWLINTRSARVASCAELGGATAGGIVQLAILPGVSVRKKEEEKGFVTHQKNLFDISKTVNRAPFV
ncbi:MAG: hypothetical protein HYW34_03490 [Candidatus Brennerbacteria bacterium]|nr:hypothetical protein [Candidatus Brennerbacteria bacterium]